MTTNPAEMKPVTTFSNAMAAGKLDALNAGAAPVAGVNAFKLELKLNGTTMGWLGQDDGQWAILVTDPAKALTLELVPESGVDYYRIKGTDRYMSVSRNSYIGFYNWLGATGFTFKGSHLVSNYNDQQLSLKSVENGYLYCWNDYSILDVIKA